MNKLVLQSFFIFLLMLTLVAKGSYGQTAKMDSLKQLIENRPDDTVKVDLMFELGNDYRLHNYLDELKLLNDEILVLSNKRDFNTGIAIYHYFHSIMIGKTGEYDKSLEELNIAENILTKTKSFKIIAFTKLHKGEIYFRKNDYKNAITNMQESIPWFSKLKLRTGLARSYRGLGIVAMEQGDSDLALESFLKSIEFFKTPDDNLILAWSCNSIGILYMEAGAFNRAIEYFEKSLLLRSQLDLHYKNTNMSTPHNNIGLAYKYLDDNEKALHHFTKAVEISPDDLFKSDVLSNISLVHLSKEEYRMSLIFNSMALHGYDATLNPTGYNILLKNRGLFLWHLKKYDSAILTLKGAIEFAQKNPSITKKRQQSLYEILSGIYFERKDYDTALFYAEKGLSSSENKTLLSIQSVLLIINKLKTLYAQNRLGNNSKFEYDNILLEIVYYNKLIDRRRESYLKFADKVELSEMTIEMYNLATLICQELYKTTNEKHYLQNALTYIEKVKTLTLSQSLLDYRAKQFSGIPDSLQEKEKELKIDIAFYQSRISELKDNVNYDSSYVQELENKLFDSNRSYELLLKKLERDYPKYHDLKYQSQIIEIAQIQQQLSKNTAVVEYLMGDTTLHVFTITNRDFQLQSLSIDSTLANNITALQQEFQQGVTKNQLGVGFEKFAGISYQLYETILAPVLPKLKGNNINRLIVIPDDKLWQVNFDLLLTQKASDQNFKDLPYLLRDYSISYGYSSTLLFGEQYKNDQKLIQECLAFSFTDSSNLTLGDNLPLRTLRNVSVDLPGSRKEVQAISNVLDGEYYYGASANEQNFKEKAKDYAILHLALHGEVDDKEPMNSKLYFTPSSDSLEDNALYAYELYNMSLNAELAVLSACNTGTGQLASGEGIMSLGRAFSYAGVKSLLVSHWDVSDKASPEIMASFYKGLKRGLSKDEALRQAKLEYLENSDIYMSNPFFWGGFVIMGDSKAMEFEDDSNWWIIASILSLLVMLALFFLRRNHNRAAR